MKRILAIFFLFFFSISIGQNINIVSFDSSAEYTPGSGVSVHLNPTGVFDFVNASDLDFNLNNSFILELSGPGGDFENLTILNTADDFYTSLINGILPNDLESGEYKLRIRSTQPALVQETDFFTVDNSITSSTPSLSSNIESNSSYTQCLNDNVNVINPFFGSFNQNYNSLSGDMPSSNKFFTVTPTSDQNTIEVNIIDLSNGTSVSLSPISGNVYQIPENLSVGTYNIEVQEGSPEGYSTFFSSAFIFHTSATIFGNASSETVCVGAEVTFNIDVGDLGIGSNSMGSYYIISFGDGSSDLILTQAELLELYSDPINPITHVFEQASCTEDGNTSFEVSFKLFNKGINAQCDNYSQNGLGASKEIATAEAPQSQFDLALEQCVNEDIEVFNTTIAGSYPAANGECGGDVDYSWLVKKPSFSDFLPVSLLSNSWVSGENLVIPAADVDEIGCWEIKLIAVNPAACLEESQFTGIINIEDIPEANFSPVGDLCKNDIINLTGESNIIPVSCDFTLPGETPTYVWSVSPDSGYSLLNDSEDNPTTLESQNPIITFTEDGSYTLSLTVTTECGSDTHSETFDVLGNPSVDFELDSSTFCSTSSYIIDFSDQLTPTYSDGFSAPTDYTWTVTGTDIDSNDYDFVNGTSSTDEFPIIQLNSFKTYDVTITVGSNCDVPDSDTIQITLNQQPTITNTITDQEICSGDESTQVDLVSDVENTTFSWVTTENENLTGYLESGTTSFLPVQTIVNSSTEIQELEFTVTPTANGCIGDPFIYNIIVNPIPIVLDESITVCSGDPFTILPADDLESEIIPVGTIYSWTEPVIDPVGAITGGASATDQSNISQTLVNNSQSVANVTYTVTPNYNGCIGDTFNVVVTVIPNVGVDNIDDQILCNGEETTAIEFSTANDSENSQSINGFTYKGSFEGNDYYISNSAQDYSDALSSATNVGGYLASISSEDENNFIRDNVLSGGQQAWIGYYQDTSAADYSEPAGGWVWASGENSTYTNWASGEPNNQCIPQGEDNVVMYSSGLWNDGCPDNDAKVFVLEVAQSNVDQDLITYLWTNDNTDIGLAEAGNGNIDSFTATNTTTDPIIANITVTSVYTYNGVSCEGESETFTITVNPSPQVEFSEDDQFITSGETSTEVNLTSSTENVSISWTAVADIGIQGLENLTGTNSIPEETLINTLNEPQTVVYTVIASGDTSDCDGIPVDYTITVNPLAQVNPVDDEILCNGDNLVVEFTSIVTGGEISYLWTNDNTDIGLADEGLGNLDFIVTNNSEESITANITVTPTFTNGDNSNQGDPINFSITVNPSAQVDNIDDINVSNGTLIGLIEFTTLNTGGTTTYEWTNDNTDIGLVDSGNESIPEFTAVNDGDIPITGTIEVTPILEENGVICSGDSETFTITVNPDAQVNEIDDLVYNDGDLVQIPFTSSNTGGDNSYEWSSTNSETGLEDSGSGDIEFTATNTVSNSPIVTTVTVIPSFTNGDDSNTGEPETFTITVNPIAQIEPTENITLCEGEELETIIFSTLNTGGTTTYEWTNDNTDIGLAANGVGDIPSFTITNDTTSALIATIEVTPTYENGGISNTGNPETFTITVNPGAQVEAVTSQVLCVGESTDEIVFATTNTDGTTTYEWINDNTDIGLAANGVGDIPSFTVTNDTTSALIATIEVTPTYENNGVTCTGNPEIFTITVLSEISITFDITDAIDCDDPNSGIVDITVSGGSGIYEFLWSDGSTNEDLTNVTSGDYSVTITDNEGCVFTSQLFNIFRQEDLVVDLTTQISAVCETSLVTQQNNISISGGLPPYEIYWSAGAVTLGDNTEMTAYENGIYNVIVTDQYGCEVDTEIIVDYDELSITGASFDYVSSGNLDCGLSIFNEIEFTNTSDGDVLGVTWDFGDGSAPVSGEIVTHQYITAGEFEVTITAQYNYGCIEVYSEEIVVSNGYDIMLPTAFSPNNDGINDTIRPVYNCVNDINMSVYDTFGSLLYYENNIDLQGWNGMLDGKKAENGNYLIVVNGTTIFGEEINLNGVFVLLR